LRCSFFSSRRRHTRSKRDWSSDVCSSDLAFFLDAVSSGLPAAQLIDPLLQAPSHAPLRVVVVAPPGTGKTTVVPPALTNRLQNRSEERRVGKEDRARGPGDAGTEQASEKS